MWRIFLCGSLSRAFGISIDVSADGRLRTAYAKSGRALSRRACLAALLAVLLVGVSVSAARADGDPGSDVLVYQNLFAGSEVGLSVQQQVQLGALLKAAAGRGFPIRVAIIAGTQDLGAVTELWREPRTYARFLGYELSLAYKQRLLVVMPNGFGFNWPGHSRRRRTACGRDLDRIGRGRVVRRDRGGSGQSWLSPAA